MNAGGSLSRTTPASGARKAPPPSPAARKPVSPTPRSLLKSESVVSYLVRPAARARNTRGACARARRAAHAASARPAAAAAAAAAQGKSAADGAAGADSDGAGAGAPPATAPAKPKPKLQGSATLGAKPATARAAPRAEPSAVMPTGTVDVEAWLADRKAKDAAREQVRWARVHQDAKFIEKLERQQEVRNRQLHEEEAAKAAAAAAAANWNTVPFEPLTAPKEEAPPDATAEEKLFLDDAERLFGQQHTTAAAR